MSDKNAQVETQESKDQPGVPAPPYLQPSFCCCCKSQRTSLAPGCIFGWQIGIFVLSFLEIYVFTGHSTPFSSEPVFWGLETAPKKDVRDLWLGKHTSAPLKCKLICPDFRHTIRHPLPFLDPPPTPLNHHCPISCLLRPTTPALSTDLATTISMLLARPRAGLKLAPAVRASKK